MNEYGRVSRRAALKILGWWMALGAASLRVPHDAAAGMDGGQPIAALLVDARRSAVAIGTLYLESHPEEAREAFLLSALGLDAKELAELSPGKLQSERRRLRSVHREDFAQCRVTDVDGFILSITEARLAALVALVVQGREPGAAGSGRASNPV
jgi:hypothetical protein